MAVTGRVNGAQFYFSGSCLNSQPIPPIYQPGFEDMDGTPPTDDPSSFVHSGELADYCWRSSLGFTVVLPEPCDAADSAGAGIAVTLGDAAATGSVTAGAIGGVDVLLSIIVSLP